MYLLFSEQGYYTICNYISIYPARVNLAFFPKFTLWQILEHSLNKLLIISRVHYWELCMTFKLIFNKFSLSTFQYMHCVHPYYKFNLINYWTFDDLELWPWANLNLNCYTMNSCNASRSLCGINQANSCPTIKNGLFHIFNLLYHTIVHCE